MDPSSRLAPLLEVRALACGDGWRAEQVDCHQGPQHRAVEEHHGILSVSCVISGLFTYHAAGACTVMTPGSLLLGNRGFDYRCSHEHGAGDRCVSFQFEAPLLEEFARGQRPIRFRGARIPPLRETVALVSRIHALPSATDSLSAEELALEVIGEALRQDGEPPPRDCGPRVRTRVAGRVRDLAERCSEQHSLAALAARAGMSRFAFLRAFRQVTGTTPYQYLLTRRLIGAAGRLLGGDDSVTTVAMESGFGDLSEFTRRFRAHFGLTPGQYRIRRAPADPPG